MSELSESGLYVCRLNLRDKRRKPLTAGSVFSKEDMVTATFDALFARGDIVPYVPGKSVTIVAPPAKGRALAGPINETPAAAINPSQSVPKGFDEVQEKERASLMEKLRNLGVGFASNCKLTTLKKKLVDFSASSTPSTSTTEPKTKRPARVWNYDPEKLQKTPTEQLFAAYKDRCVEYDQEIGSFNSRDLLIEKMSSEFNL